MTLILNFKRKMNLQGGRIYMYVNKKANFETILMTCAFWYIDNIIDMTLLLYFE